MPAKAKAVDLASRRPDLVPFLDRDLNPDIDDLTAIRPQGKIIHWKCPQGHTWSSQVLYQVQRKWLCPECVSLGYLFPELAEELNPVQVTDPRVSSLTLASSVKLADWVGKHCGHEWTMNIRARTRGGYQCPFCSNQRILVGFNDLATTHPEIAALWSPNNSLSSQEVTYGSRKLLLWVSPECGHEWARSLNHLTKLEGIRCPTCFPFMGGGKPSYRETQLFEWVSKRYPEAEQSRRDLLEGRNEVDIYLPSLRVAIEFNGEHWHSDDMLLKSKKMTSLEYHRGKRRMARERGIELLFIWETDWVKSKATLLKELEAYLEVRSIDDATPPPSIFQKLVGKN